MLEKKKISVARIFPSDLRWTSHGTLLWVDGDDLARRIEGAKAKIIVRIVKEKCEICGKPATRDQICQKCGKKVCDDCAKKDATGRYCPVCFERVKSVSKLA